LFATIVHNPMSESTSPDRKIPLPIELGASAGSDPPLLTPPTDIGEPGVAGESFAHGGQAALRSWVGAKLAGGMFLHYFAIGAWSVTLASYVKAHTGDSPDSMFAPGFVGMIYGAGPLGGLFSPSITCWGRSRKFESTNGAKLGEAWRARLRFWISRISKRCGRPRQGLGSRSATPYAFAYRSLAASI
jgi:hypothetical protein